MLALLALRFNSPLNPVKLFHCSTVRTQSNSTIFTDATSPRYSKIND